MAGVKLPTLKKGRMISARGAHIKGIKSPHLSIKTTVPKMKAMKKISTKVASPLKFKA